MNTSANLPVHRTFRMRRIVQQAQRCERRIEFVLEEIRRGAEIDGDRPMHIPPERPDSLEIGEQRVPPARDVRPLVHGPEGLASGYSRVICCQVQANIEGFLEVGRRTRVQVFTFLRHVTAIGFEEILGERHLGVQRQRKKGM